MPANIGRGDQFKDEFLAISPNNRMPAVVDTAPKGGGAPISVSPPIRLHLIVRENSEAAYAGGGAGTKSE